MKRNLSALLAIILAITASSFVAIHQSKTEKTLQSYYWFNLSGLFLGHSAGAPTGCDFIHSRDCAYGFINIDDPNDPTEPGGTPDLTAKKQ